MIQWMSRWPASKKIALSFAIVILIGSIFLTLPMSQKVGSQATYFDNLFNAVSMVCVTGLFIESIFDSYTIFGQIICMILIQIGGLGLMTLIASIITRFNSRGMSMSNRMAVQAGIGQDNMFVFGTYVANIIRYTFFIELTGVILLALRFVPLLGWSEGLFTSLFLSVSAFNNAGFDNLGNNSMIDFQADPIVTLTLGSLIIMGGIGFSVWFDLAQKGREFFSHVRRRSPIAFFRSLTLHSRLALLITFILLVGGTIAFVLGEFNNPATIGNSSFGDQILVGFFETTTMRTAGFATIDYTVARPITLFIFIMTMFIGGSPGGTAGGLKTTTFGILVLIVLNGLRGQKNVNLWWHTIPEQMIRQASIVFLMYILMFIFGSGILLTLNPTINPLFLMFETVSALATVGVSAGLTPDLETPSHIILMIIMFTGRIGPITMVDSLFRRNETHTDITYIKGNIIIG